MSILSVLFLVSVFVKAEHLLFYNIDNSILFQLPERKTRIFASSTADIVSENLPSKGYIFPVFPLHSPVQTRAKIVDSMLFELSNEHVNRYTFPVSSVTDSSCEGFNLIFLVLLFNNKQKHKISILEAKFLKRLFRKKLRICLDCQILCEEFAVRFYHDKYHLWQNILL